MKNRNASASTAAATPEGNQASTLTGPSFRRVKSESSATTNATRGKKATANSTSIRSRLLDKSGPSSTKSEFALPSTKFRTVMGSSHAQGDDEFEYEADFQDDEEGIARVDEVVGEEEQKEIEVSWPARGLSTLLYVSATHPEVYALLHRIESRLSSRRPKDSNRPKRRTRVNQRANARTRTALRSSDWSRRVTRVECTIVRTMTRTTPTL